MINFIFPLYIWWELNIGDNSDIILSSPTQPMDNTTEVEYISIYGKPKRARGRPCGNKYSDEEKRQQTEKQILVAITIIMNIILYKSEVIDKQKMKQQKMKQNKTSSENQLFLGFLKHEFSFKH